MNLLKTFSGLLVCLLLVYSSNAADPPAAWTSKALPKEPLGKIPAFAKTPDGKLIAGWLLDDKNPMPPGYPFATTRLYDDAGKVLATWRRLGPTTVALSPDGAWLAIGTESNVIHIVNVKDRKIVRKIPGKLTIGPNGTPIGIEALAFSTSASEPVLVVGSGAEPIKSYDPATGKLLNSLAHGVKNASVTFTTSPNNSLIVSFGPEMRKTTFDLKKWDVEQKLPAKVIGRTVSADGNVLAVASFDLTVTLFDCESLKVLSTVKEKGDVPKIDVAGFFVMCPMALSPKGDRLFTSTEYSQGLITVWDVKTGKATGSFKHAPPKGTLGNPTLHLAATPEGKLKSYWSNVDVYPPLLWSPPEEKK